MEKIKQALSALGLFIENGIARVKELKVDKLIIGNTEKPNSITLYDRTTREPYCVFVENGVLKNIKGSCEEVFRNQLNENILNFQNSIQSGYNNSLNENNNSSDMNDNNK